LEQLECTSKFDTGRLADMIVGICREASSEIAGFDSEIGPFASMFPRSESASSSQIEQFTASAERILMAEAGDTSRINATLIASNTAAMKAALTMADDLKPDSILVMHAALPGVQQAVRVEQ